MARRDACPAYGLAAYARRLLMADALRMRQFDGLIDSDSN
jgi:hypothetical protein